MGLIEDFLELLREQNTPEGRDLKARRLAQKYEGGGIIGGPLMDAYYDGDSSEPSGEIEKPGEIEELGEREKPGWPIPPKAQEPYPDLAVTDDVVDAPLTDEELFRKNTLEQVMRPGGAQGIEFSGMTPDIVELIREQARNHPQLGGAAQTPGGGGAISMYDSNVTYDGEPIQQYHDREMGQMRDEQPYRQAEYELTNKEYGDPERGAQIMAAMLQGRQAEMLPTQIAREYEVGMETARQRQRKNDIDEYKVSPEYLQALGESKQSPYQASAPQQEQFSSHILQIVSKLVEASPDDAADIEAAGQRIISAIYSDPTLQKASEMLQALMGGGTMTMGDQTAQVGLGTVDISDADSFLTGRRR